MVHPAGMMMSRIIRNRAVTLSKGNLTKPCGSVDIGPDGAMNPRHVIHMRRWRASAGFTLIELGVVLILLSIACAIAIPRYGAFLVRGTMRSEARRLAGLAKYLSNEASRTRKPHYINFDVSRDKYWVTVDEGKGRPVKESTHLSRPRTVSGGVKISDVTVRGRGKRRHGRHRVGFYAKAENDEAIIHFTDTSRDASCSLYIKPYCGMTQIYDYHFKGYRESFHPSF